MAGVMMCAICGKKFDPQTSKRALKIYKAHVQECQKQNVKKEKENAGKKHRNHTGERRES
jgi:transcription elongation factor Elf1